MSVQLWTFIGVAIALAAQCILLRRKFCKVFFTAEGFVVLTGSALLSYLAGYVCADPICALLFGVNADGLKFHWPLEVSAVIVSNFTVYWVINRAHWFGIETHPECEETNGETR